MLSKYEEVKLQILYGQDEFTQAHQEIELVYIVDGSADIFVDEVKTTLTQQDILLINSGRRHSIKAKETSILFKIYISYQIMAEYIHENYLFFWCDTTLDTSDDSLQLKKILQKLMLNFLENNGQVTFSQKELTYRLLNFIADNYKVDRTKAEIPVRNGDSKRLDFILHYIHLHYAQPIALCDIAKLLYISDSSLSRFFKKETGVSFVDYVNEVRLHYAIEDLLMTDLPMTHIAVNNGFSTPSAFNRIFKAVYGITPSEYRNEKTVKKKFVLKELTPDAKQKLIDDYSKKLLEKVSVDSQNEKIIIANTSMESQLWEDKNKILNIGDAILMETAKIQEQVVYLMKQLKFDYVRIWNLFSLKFMITQDLSSGAYNFEILDSVLDFFVKNQIKLFLDFTPRKSYAMVSGTDTLYEKQGQMEFTTQNEWIKMLKNLTAHMIRRYGREIVSTWIFELSLGAVPHHAGPNDFAKIYQEGYSVIKNLIPLAKIAGPGLVVDTTKEKIHDWISVCKSYHCVPDIFTFISFPYYQEDSPDKSIRKRMMDQLFIRHQAEKMHQLLKENDMNCRLCMTEWSNSLSNRNPLQDSCARGTYIIRNMMSVWKMVDMMGFWYGSDWLSAYFDSRQVLHGGAGILSKDGIPKPSYFAFYFLKRLGKYLLRIGNNYIITRDESGDLYVLCYNHKEYSTYYYIKDEANYQAEEMNRLFQDEDSLTLQFHLKELQNHVEYVIKKRTINQENGSVFNEWMQLSDGGNLGTDEINYLKMRCMPKIQIDRYYVTKNELAVSITLKAHEMTLLHIYKE